ncbi:MAG TPA: FAD-binding oxidoreductase [Pseudonocardiaceae bacterium]|nr:FAD-binding oxidoreductase [Pseudonocardiaceae bacterium]
MSGRKTAVYAGKLNRVATTTSRPVDLGCVDALEERDRGRACYRQRAWLDAHTALSHADEAGGLEAPDLELLAMAGFLIGQDHDAVRVLERTHHVYLQASDLVGAARCAIWTGFGLLDFGEPAQAFGWFGRAARLLDRTGRDCAERGYLLVPDVIQHLDDDAEAAFQTAAAVAEVGDRCHDADLVTFALHAQGRARIRQGRVAEGAALLDEAMVAVIAGELASPLFTGLIYCGVIDACREVYGPLRTPRDTGFAEATQLWNGIVTKAPALVVTAAGTADVVEAVNFAREHGLALSVRGGGHNIAGTALADNGLTIDMSGLRGITVNRDARTATVQAGCLLGEVDRATQEHGLATPLGFISEVGVAGLTLGGGLGYLTRRFGWTVDNLLTVEIVTADGRVRRASRDEHPDLFWAIRGAGANVGVVTSFTFRLHEVGPTVYGGLIAWPGDRVHEILRAYRTITSRAPRELAVWLVLMNAPPAPFVPRQWHGKKICAMAVCYTGDPAHTNDVVAPIRAIGDPIVDLLAEQPYTRVQSYLDDGEPKGMHYYWKTDYAAELSDELLELTEKLFADCPIPGIECGFLHVGGAINEHDEDDGAVGNRNARYVIGANGKWAPGEPQAAQYREWIRDASNQLHPLGTGRTYVNFQTADEDFDRVRASYGPNFDRLVEIKKSYDRNNLFCSNRNIRIA